jgi:hypothetical protein
MQTNDHQQDWRARAEEMRAIGNQMHDQLAREEMLRLANKYERLAAWTEERSPLLRVVAASSHAPACRLPTRRRKGG